MKQTDKLQNQISEAEQLLAASDASALHRMFVDKCDDVEKLLLSLQIIMDNGKNTPRINTDPIYAMRDVSIEAIKLARDVVASELVKVVKDKKNEINGEPLNET